MAVIVDLDELYDASYDRLVVQIYALCGDMTTAEDAVQEAFVTAIRKRPRGRRRRTTPRRGCARWRSTGCGAGWRHAAVVRKYQADGPGPQVPVEIGREHIALVATLAQLDLEQWRVVVLHHVADLSVGEIAVQPGSPRAR